MFVGTYTRSTASAGIYAFEVEAGGEEIRAIQHCPSGGAHPRNFAPTPDGDRLFAANRDSDNIVIFRRHAETGLLTNTGKVIDVPAPSCVLFT